MNAIKLLHTADIHIGIENYGRTTLPPGSRVCHGLPAPAERHRRLRDRAGVDVFVFAGEDKTRDRNPTHQREFARRIKKIGDAGIPVIMLVGNHDLPAVAKRATSIDIFARCMCPMCTWATARRSFRSPAAAAAAADRDGVVSAAHRAAGQRTAAGQESNELDVAPERHDREYRRARSAGQAAADVPAILVGHFSVNEASHGSEQNIMIGRDAAIPRSILADPAFRYVALGHIHKHQSLNTDLQPPVLYSGSIERIDFGEEHEPKGFVVAEIGDGPTTWEFVRGYQRQARPFVTVRADVRDAANPTAAVVAAIRVWATCPRRSCGWSSSCARIRKRWWSSGRSSGRWKACIRSPLQKEIERTERQRLGAVSVEALTPAELLERYF